MIMIFTCIHVYIDKLKGGRMVPIIHISLAKEAVTVDKEFVTVDNSIHTAATNHSVTITTNTNNTNNMAINEIVANNSNKRVNSNTNIQTVNKSNKTKGKKK